MMLAGTRSYYDDYVRKRGTGRSLNDPPSLLTDRGAYLNFLEVQLERVSAACLNVNAYDDRFNDMQSLIVSLDQRCGNLAKLISSSQNNLEVMKENTDQDHHNLKTQFLNEVESIKGVINALEINANTLKENTDEKINNFNKYFEDNIKMFNLQFQNYKNDSDFSIQQFSKQVEEMKSIQQQLIDSVKDIENKFSNLLRNLNKNQKANEDTLTSLRSMMEKNFELFQNNQNESLQAWYKYQNDRLDDMERKFSNTDTKNMKILTNKNVVKKQLSKPYYLSHTTLRSSRPNQPIYKGKPPSPIRKISPLSIPNRNKFQPSVGHHKSLHSPVRISSRTQFDPYSQLNKESLIVNEPVRNNQHRSSSPLVISTQHRNTNSNEGGNLNSRLNHQQKILHLIQTQTLQKLKKKEKYKKNDENRNTFYPSIPNLVQDFFKNDETSMPINKITLNNENKQYKDGDDDKIFLTDTNQVKNQKMKESVDPKLSILMQTLLDAYDRHSQRKSDDFMNEYNFPIQSEYLNQGLTNASNQPLLNTDRLDNSISPRKEQMKLNIDSNKAAVISESRQSFPTPSSLNETEGDIIHDQNKNSARFGYTKEEHINMGEMKQNQQQQQYLNDITTHNYSDTQKFSTDKSLSQTSGLQNYYLSRNTRDLNQESAVEDKISSINPLNEISGDEYAYVSYQQTPKPVPWKPNKSSLPLSWPLSLPINTSHVQISSLHRIPARVPMLPTGIYESKRSIDDSSTITSTTTSTSMRAKADNTKIDASGWKRVLKSSRPNIHGSGAIVK